MSNETPTPGNPAPAPGNGPGDSSQFQSNWPPFDPGAPHQQKPKLRPIRGFGVQQGDRPMLGLADLRQISEKVVFTSPAVQVILPHLNGEHGIEEIVRRVNETLSKSSTQIGDRLTAQMLEQFVAQLDDAALIEGPNAQALIRKVREEFNSAATLPPSVTASVADAIVAQEIGESVTDEQKAEQGPRKLKGMFDAWIAEALKDAEDPSFNALPRAIVAPHLDYARGWLNYASVYGRLRVVDRPDRVVILGTNHFGYATGVCGCDKGFQTPLGTSPLDETLVAALKERLGVENAARLFEHRYDHEREHSIELQIAWLQHVFAPTDAGTHLPVFAALIHDPTAKNGKSYDGAGLDLQPFVDALKGALGAMPGRTLVVSSADLSHVGPQFGDRVPLGGDQESNPQGVAARTKAIEHDRRMIDFIGKRKPDELVAAMTWQKNPTRWCSVGNLVATMKVVDPGEVKLLNYTAAMDQQGMAMVSSLSAAMF